MAKITSRFSLAAVFTVEFDSKLYFRVEILEADSGEPIQTTQYIAEVYQLRWPNGVMAAPSPRGDTRFRQSWLYLDDFPAVSASTVESLRADLLPKLSAYADAYLHDYNTGLRRPQPPR
jgi:hypothetical protein